MALVRERATRHGIAVEVEVAPDVGTLVGDELRFKQVLLNLMSNAVKFTPDGGQVTVAAQPWWRTAAGAGHRHRPRHRHRRPGADLRVLPAGRTWHPQRGGHRARPDAVAAAGRADGRRAVAGHRGGARQHVRVLGAGSTGRRRADRGAASRWTAGRSRWWRWSRTTRWRSTCSPCTCRAPGFQVVSARDGAAGIGARPPAVAGRGRARHPAARSGRVGGPRPALGRPGHRRDAGGRGQRRRRAPTGHGVWRGRRTW